MLDARCWMLDTGYWMLDAGCWMLGRWMYLSRVEHSTPGIENRGMMQQQTGKVRGSMPLYSCIHALSPPRLLTSSLPRPLASHLCLMSCILCFLLFFSHSSMAAFRDSFLGAKSVAMGGAYTALADDVDGALVNPAGLSMIEGQQIIATMAALYIGLSDDSLISQNILGYAYQKGGIGTLGVVWKRFGAGGLYSENVLAFSFARSFRFYPGKKEENGRENVSFGSTLNLMSWDSAPTVGADGKVVEDLPGWNGVSFDVGLVIWPSENIAVAVALQDVNRPNIVSAELSKVEEKLSRTVRMGVAAMGEKVTWAMDIVLREGQINLRGGVEKQAYNGSFLLRMGFGLENLAWGTNLALGAGYNLNDSVRIDYAFVYPVNTILDTIGSHRISVVYDF